MVLGWARLFRKVAARSFSMAQTPTFSLIALSVGVLQQTGIYISQCLAALHACWKSSGVESLHSPKEDPRHVPADPTGVAA